MKTPIEGGPYTITFKATNTVVLKNILIGEVWICSGQSNMEMNNNCELPRTNKDVLNSVAENSPFIFFEECSHFVRTTKQVLRSMLMANQ